MTRSEPLAEFTDVQGDPVAVFLRCPDGHPYLRIIATSLFSGKARHFAINLNAAKLLRDALDKFIREHEETKP